MTGIRKFLKADLFAIMESSVETNRGDFLTDEMAADIENSGKAFTYVKDDKPVGCCGAGLIDGIYNIWAAYSDSFTMMTRARAVVSFGKAMRKLFPGTMCEFSIPSDLCNGAKYAKFMGGVYKKTVNSEMFDGITNDIYEVI